MTRSANILGFAFLALAATLTAMITMRNSPQPIRRDRVVSQAQSPRGRVSAGRSAIRGENPEARALARSVLKQRPRITLDRDWLDTLPEEERQDWLERAASVERKAYEQLEHLTAQLELSHAQRDKLFPALARSAPGFDPLMLVGGVPGYGRDDLTPAEEIHALLDQDQQAAVEDADVSRQLWWQSIIDRLEADLTYETGGAILGGEAAPAPAEPVMPGVEREAPAARDGGNLFDMFNR